MPDARLTRLVDHLRPGHLDDVDRAIVVRLEGLPPGPIPASEFQADLRRQLISLAPDLLAEHAMAPTGDEAERSEPAPTKPSGKARTHRAIGRPLVVFGSAAAVLVMLLGLTVWLSGNALPGDTLYGIKKASENVQLSVTRGDTARGSKYLEFASTRVAETAKLIGRSTATAGARPGADAISQHVSSLVVSTLATGDLQTREGASLIAQAAVAQVDRAVLAPLLPWTAKQHAALAAIQQRLPGGPAKAAATKSLALIDQLTTRVAALRTSIGCSCVTAARADSLGPLPCTACPSTPKSKTTTPTSPPDQTGTKTTPPPSHGTGKTTPKSPGGKSDSGQPGSSTGNHPGQSTPPKTGGTTPPTSGGGGSTPTSTCILVICLPPTSGTGPGLCLPGLVCVSIPGIVLPNQP
ncbi:MAG: DUF5667 domain-containing protein [Jatrophihabitans sp.]